MNVPDGILDFEQLATAATLPIQTMVKVEGASVSGAPASTGILIEENGSAQFGSGAVLNASLTLEPGAKLVFDDVLTMVGYLTLRPGMLLEGALLSGIDAMKPGDCIVLIHGYGDGLQYSENLNDNQANLYFNNIDAAFKLMADESKFGLVMGMAVPTPEPATGMLSLMAIATLAARRRGSRRSGSGCPLFTVPGALAEGSAVPAFQIAGHGAQLLQTCRVAGARATNCCVHPCAVPQAFQTKDCGQLAC